jgi:hypothetical protein
MLGWMLLGAAGLAVLGKVSDNIKAENNSFQSSTKSNNYSQYVTLQLVAMPEYETYIYVDDLLFCRVHHENPHSYIYVSQLKTYFRHPPLRRWDQYQGFTGYSGA